MENKYHSGLKHCEKRKNCLFRAFSPVLTRFSTAVYLLMCENVVLCGNGLTWIKTFCMCINPFPNKPWFLRVCRTSLLKTLWEKEKLLVTSNFSFSHSVFYPFEALSSILIKLEIVVCKLFRFGRV